MPRQMFTDDLWTKLKMVLLKMGIYDKPLLRLTIEGIFYRLRVGCPWRDLPSVFGSWNAIYKRFNEWSRKEKLMNIFNELVVEPDLEWEYIDGSIVKAHQHSSGAAYGQESAIGKSVAGNTTVDNIVNNGHTIQVNYQPGSILAVSGHDHMNKTVSFPFSK